MSKFAKLFSHLINWWYITAKVIITICITVGILSIFASSAPISYAQTVVPNTTVYNSPECTCCGKWMNHLKEQGFAIKNIPTTDIEQVKQKYNIPNNLTSCHTAIINGYVIEGHVPADDIKRLLAEKPNVAGLTVPQMPVGTPGMEIGNQKDPFTVFSFAPKGKVGVFNKYDTNS